MKLDDIEEEDTIEDCPKYIYHEYNTVDRKINRSGIKNFLVNPRVLASELTNTNPTDSVELFEIPVQEIN